MTFFIFCCILCSYITVKVHGAESILKENRSSNATVGAPATTAVDSHTYVLPRTPVLPASNDVVEYVDQNGKSQSATAEAMKYKTMSGGWHYVDGRFTSDWFNITGDVKIILKDNSRLEAESIEGIGTLTIYCQSGGNGVVYAQNFNGKSAISVSTLIINGGNISAYGDDDCAGIGGYSGGAGKTITINGGTVKARAGKNAAGIGGGKGGNGGLVTITGGWVTVEGQDFAAGIGGGKGGNGGEVRISGGRIYTTGGIYGAGIGGGQDGNGSTVRIGGGTVRSEGGGAMGKNAEDIGAGWGEGTRTSGSLMDAMGVNVYLNNITVGDPIVANALVTGRFIGLLPFSIKDVVTNGLGEVYFYLPSSEDEEGMILTVGGKDYEGTYKRAANHNNVQTLRLHLYAVDVSVSSEGGSVTAEPANAPEGSTVTLKVLPEAHHMLQSISAYMTGKGTTTVELLGGGNTRVFTMPKFDVSVTATFEYLNCTDRTPGESESWPCGNETDDPLCYQDIGGTDENTCVTSCSNAIEDVITGLCVVPEPAPAPGAATPLKRSLALAVIAVVMAWLL